MRLLQTFVRAHTLLSDRSLWTQGSFARDSTGAPCLLKSPTAVCFCMVGALAKVDLDLSDQTDVEGHVRMYYSPFLMKVLKVSTLEQVFEFNDSASYEDVIRVLDLCIQEIKSSSGGN